MKLFLELFVSELRLPQIELTVCDVLQEVESLARQGVLPRYITTLEWIAVFRFHCDSVIELQLGKIQNLKAQTQPPAAEISPSA